MIAALRRLVDVGAEGLPAGEARHVRILNWLCVLIIAIILVYGPLLAMFGDFDLVFVYGAAACGLAGVLVIDHRGHTTLARHVANVTTTAMVLGGMLVVGIDALGPIYFLLVVLGVWSIFPRAERSAAWAWSAIDVALFVGCERAAHGYHDTVDADALRAMTLGGLAFITVAYAYYQHRAVDRAEAALAAEQQKTADLLHNVLPRAIADRLMAGEQVADRFEAATVLFADLVGFTTKAEKLPPDRLVAMLDDMFRRFDRHCDRLGLEKVKTIGDAYMAAAGIPTPRADHAAAAIELALAIQGEVPDGLALRIGIHTGPVVAGVIGARKFAYDLWGDTVNTASRMESHGVAGRIQVTEAVRDALADRYAFEPRGEIQVKGKGAMRVYLVTAPGSSDRTSR